ncbi:flagellar hook-associated protein 2 [Clostridia bacterium]|nr:flagellar hook-associated protein 2 [Clostridia bacterium]
MYTSQMRMTGTSGIDVDSIVKQLMKAEGAKYDKLKQTRQKLVWTQEAYRNVSTAISTFQDSFLNIIKPGNFRSASNFSNFEAKVSSGGKDTTAVTARPGDDAIKGAHTLEVVSTATTASYKNAGAQGRSFSSSGTFVASSLDDTGNQFSVSLDGTTKTISLSAGEVATIKGAADGGAEFQTIINGKLQAAFGTEGTVPTAKASVAVDANGIVSFSTTQGHTLSMTANASTKAIGFTDNDPLTSKLTGSTKIGALLSDFTNGNNTFKINNTEITVSSADTFDELAKKVKDATNGDVTLSYDALRGGFEFKATESGAGGNFTLEGKFLVNGLGFDGNAGSGVLSGANETIGSDAVIILDGVRTTRSSNNFEIAGINFSLTDASAGETFTIDVSNNTQKTIDQVKSFVAEYNKIIDTLIKAVGTNRPKSDSYTYYEPLTDDQKAAMSEDDIKSWDEKAKAGFLYGDATIDGILRTMRSTLYEPVTLADGSKISLYQIGVSTTAKTSDQGKLEIDENKLKAAVEKGLDIAALFTKSSDISSTDKTKAKERLKDEGIAERINDIFSNAIGFGGALRNKAGIVGTVSEFQNTLYDQLSKKDKELAAMMKALQSKENNYYATYAKMEAAMNDYNSQMASLGVM